MFGPQLLPFTIDVLLVLGMSVSVVAAGLLFNEVAPKYAWVYVLFLFLLFGVVLDCLKH